MENGQWRHHTTPPHPHHTTPHRTRALNAWRDTQNLTLAEFNAKLNAYKKKVMVWMYLCVCLVCVLCLRVNACARPCKRIRFTRMHAHTQVRVCHGLT